MYAQWLHGVCPDNVFLMYYANSLTHFCFLIRWLYLPNRIFPVRILFYWTFQCTWNEVMLMHIDFCNSSTLSFSGIIGTRHLQMFWHQICKGKTYFSPRNNSSHSIIKVTFLNGFQHWSRNMNNTQDCNDLCFTNEALIAFWNIARSHFDSWRYTNMEIPLILEHPCICNGSTIHLFTDERYIPPRYCLCWYIPGDVCA